MENKFDILMFISAILGGVLGAYLCAKGNPSLGSVVIVFCMIIIIGRTAFLWQAAIDKRNAEKIAAKKAWQAKKQLELKEKEKKYNTFRNDLIARNGEPGKVVLIHDNRFEQFNINNELIVFDKVRKLWLCGHEISIDDINSFTIDDESVILKGHIKAVTSTNTGSMAGRSIAGALIGGEAGAIIGGATAKKETVFHQENDKLIHDYALIVNVRDLNNPMLLIKIGRDKNKAMEINALMQAVMTLK